MSSWTVIGLVVAAGVAIIAAIVIAATARRSPGRTARRRPRRATRPASFEPPLAGGELAIRPPAIRPPAIGPPGIGPPAIGIPAQALPAAAVAPPTAPNGEPPAESSPHLITRRQLLNRGIIAAFVAALSGVVASAIAFAWPEISGGGRRSYAVGGLGAVHRRLAAEGRPYVGANGRFYLVPFPVSRLREAQARAVYPPEVIAGMREGLVALSAVCPHQGCHVPYCDSSAWFECPCHGSRFDAIGELRRGPAARGLDHYALSVVAGLVTVDTTRSFRGAPPGTETLDDPPKGPHCY